MAVTDDQGVPIEGSTGAYTYYQRNGKTIMRVRHAPTHNKGRTFLSMASRTKLSNVNEAWGSFNGKLKGLLEPQKLGQTDYNVFMSVNRTNARVCLTKDEAQFRTCVADNFCVSMGQLTPPVQVREEEEWVVSDLPCGELQITPETRIDEVTKNLCGLSNGLLHPGDELAFVSMRQSININTHLPHCFGTVERLPLANLFGRTVGEVMSFHASLDGFQNRGGFLAWKKQPDTLVAWVRVRPVEKRHPLVTTQSLFGTPPLLARYTSEEQIQEAIGSYGPLKKTW